MSWLSTFSRAVGTLRRSFANPSPDSLRAFGVQPARAGVEVTERTALSASSVFACVRNLAEDVAKLPIKIYRDLHPAGKELLNAHPMYALLNQAGNPEQTAFEVRQCLTAQAVLYGNGRAEIERTKGGRPIALWPIEPWRIRVMRDPTGTLYYSVDGGRSRLALVDVFDVAGFSIHGIIGEMVARVGTDSIGLAIAAERFAASFFGNGARTSGVISHPAQLSDKAYANLKATFNATYAGPDNAHQTPILEEGAKYEQMSTAPNEAQMIEARQFQVEDVARWFRMPPHKIGHLERAQGWSTLESANTDYIVDTLMPWFTRWEQEIKRKGIQSTELDVWAEHLVAGMLRGDTTARYAAYSSAISAGWMNYDEVRALENLNPIPGGFGSIHRVPLNTKRIDAPDATPAPPPPTPGDPEPAPPKADPAVEDKGARSAAMNALVGEQVRRLLRVESDKVRRAAAKPGFPKWLEQFYGGHVDYVSTALNPVCRVFNAPDFDARAYAAESKRDLLSAVADGVPETLVERVDAILDRWQLERPAKVAARLTAGK